MQLPIHTNFPKGIYKVSITIIIILFLVQFEELVQ